MPAPTRLTIPYDDYHARHVGKTADGRQFFLMTPFEPGGNEYVALLLWDADGTPLGAEVDSFGPRDSMDQDARRAAHERRLAELGDVTYGPIEVAPFSVERFGSEIGLLATEVEDDDWVVTLEPGDSMCFYEPWDSGDYDT
jgi:hypothetical protein